jgi:hypothetical protein
MVMSPVELGPENDYAGEGQQQSSERMSHKDYEGKCSFKKILVVSLKGLGAKTN